MAQIGISTSANGQLEIDSDELSDALEDNFDDVLKLMTAYGEPSHANVRFFTSSAETEDGTYAVEITGVGGSFGGTIGGYAAYVQGSNMLVGASGTPVEGLTVMFTGDSAGSYGTVSFTAGFMEKIDRLVDGYLNSSTGLIKSKENSIDRQIRYNESVIERKEKVLDRVEQRLMEQFTKMESALARMQSQSSMLTSLSLFQ
jgi:flagellar hook-associated protein 2